MKKNIVEDVPYIFNSNLFILLLLACVNLSGMSESMNSKKKSKYENLYRTREIYEKWLVVGDVWHNILFLKENVLFGDYQQPKILNVVREYWTIIHKNIWLYEKSRYQYIDIEISFCV